jgi:hypothetical protein
MKDVGTTVEMTTIPVCSLRSTTSNQVHATLHSDQSSHIKQHKKSNDRERGKGRERMKEPGEEVGKRPGVGDKMGRTYFDMDEGKHSILI